jgi:hypothetical protein
VTVSGFGDADGEAVGEPIARGRSETRLPNAVRKPESSSLVTMSLSVTGGATMMGVWATESVTAVGIGSLASAEGESVAIAKGGGAMLAAAAAV